MVVGEYVPIGCKKPFLLKINTFNAGTKEFYAVFLPKPGLIRLRVAEAPMAHINVHERRATEKMVGFIGNNHDVVIAAFADMPGSGNAADAVA